MTDPVRVIESQIAMLRLIAENVTDECVAEVAKAVDSDVKATIAAGTDAYGKPWTPNKDGTPFRFVAASDVVTGSIGRTIITRIKTREAVLHHHGFARGGVKRPILPIGKLPPRMQAAIKAAAVRAMQSVVEGGGT